MRFAWALVAGLLLGIGVAWWLGRASPDELARKRERAEQAAAANLEDARPVLYRWRDASGALQITDTPPKGRQYERIDKEPAPGIVIDNRRGE